MNRVQEFRRLLWLSKIQDLIYQQKQTLLTGRLAQINSDTPAFEFSTNELARLLDAEREIVRLSYTYDFSEEFDADDVKRYFEDFVGLIQE